MNILDEIVANKRKEIEEKKQVVTTRSLENSLFFETPVVSMSDYLRRENQVGIIAEIKRASPSEGEIHRYIDVEQLSIGYMQSGASAISVLTDTKYFMGSNEDLSQARKFNYCPILRKDFIVDEFQVLETKSIGADCLLLIAAALTPQESASLGNLARELGMEVLLEVRSKEEIGDHLNENISLVGVNNRNLENFEVSLETSLSLAEAIPDDMPKVSESGISNPDSIIQLKKAGYDGFLVGTHFMRHANPEMACTELVGQVKAMM